jgi:hypothetical protein
VALPLVDVDAPIDEEIDAVAKPDVDVLNSRLALDVNVADPDVLTVAFCCVVELLVKVACAEVLDETIIVGVADIVALALVDVDNPRTALVVTVAKPERLDADVTGIPPSGAPSLAAIKAIVI